MLGPCDLKMLLDFKGLPQIAIAGEIKREGFLYFILFFPHRSGGCSYTVALGSNVRLIIVSTYILLPTVCLHCCCCCCVSLKSKAKAVVNRLCKEKYIFQRESNRESTVHCIVYTIPLTIELWEIYLYAWVHLHLHLSLGHSAETFTQSD